MLLTVHCLGEVAPLKEMVVKGRRFSPLERYRFAHGWWHMLARVQTPASHVLAYRREEGYCLPPVGIPNGLAPGVAT